MTKFIHTCFEVGDLDRSVAFYATVLGFEPVDEHDTVHGGEGLRLVYLRCAESGHELELLHWADRNGLPPAGKRETHIAVAVDDLEAEHARLAALGLTMEPAVTDFCVNDAVAARYFYVWDPDGNAIEFMQRNDRYR
jgi:lactoylglutathione lyase